MRFIKRLGWTALGLVGLVILFYLVLLAINWRDQPPSAATTRLEQTVTSRPSVPTAQNALTYLYGFAAPADEDPFEVGARRAAWLATFDDTTRTHSDPLRDPVDFNSNGSPVVADLRKKCAPEDRKSCAEVFTRAAESWQPTATETLALQRYRTLLGLRAWREILPLHIAAPLPAYGGVIQAQHLHLLSLMQLAGGGNVAEIRVGLSADFDYWRAAQRNAETLISKMIAIAALRNHFFYSNLILRRIPAQQVMEAMPPDWLRAFTDDERSMQLVMGGELIYVREILEYSRRSGDLVDSANGTLEPTTSGRLLDRLVGPLFKVQDTTNIIAEQYLHLSEQFAVPMSQYLEAKAALEKHASTHEHSYSAYNPFGDFFIRMDDGTHYISYAFRTANPEGLRRAVLLVTQLRARALNAAAIAGEVARSELRDPFTGAAFAWDAEHASVVFTGREDGQWSRHEFFY